MMVAVDNIKTGDKFYIQNNFAITSKTTALEYFQYAKASYNTLWSDKYQTDYEIEITDYVRIYVTWVVFSEEDKKKIAEYTDSKNPIKALKQLNKFGGNKRHYSTSSFTKDSNNKSTKKSNKKNVKDRWVINPLEKSGKSSVNTLCTLDVETIESSSSPNKQIPPVGGYHFCLRK